MKILVLEASDEFCGKPRRLSSHSRVTFKTLSSRPEDRRAFATRNVAPPLPSCALDRFVRPRKTQAHPELSVTALTPATWSGSCKVFVVVVVDDMLMVDKQYFESRSPPSHVTDEVMMA